MRARRDPFARHTLRPVPLTTPRPDGCAWCGQRAQPRRPLYHIRHEPDTGRATFHSGAFCSWACAEAYHDQRLAR